MISLSVSTFLYVQRTSYRYGTHRTVLYDQDERACWALNESLYPKKNFFSFKFSNSFLPFFLYIQIAAHNYSSLDPISHMEVCIERLFKAISAPPLCNTRMHFQYLLPTKSGIIKKIGQFKLGHDAIISQLNLYKYMRCVHICNNKLTAYWYSAHSRYR